MQFKKLSLEQSKFTQGIKEYDTNKYMLKLNLHNAPFSLYAINEGQFLIRYTSHQITDIFLDRKLKKVLQLNISNKEQEQLSNILISGYLYEAICRAGVSVSALTANLSLIKDFVHKCLQQWNVSSPYEFTLITPQIEEYSSGACVKRTCFLKGYTGNYEIGLSHKNDIFLNNGKKIYYLLQPDILKSHPLNSTKIGVVEKALYWMMLANMHFNVGYGDNIFCLQIDFGGFLDVKEYYKDADIWGYENSNKWFETPAYMHELLEVKNPESIELNDETIESLMLASIKLKRIYNNHDEY